MDLVIHGGGRIPQHLLEVSLLEKRILAEQLIPVSVSGQDLENSSNRDPHTAYARFASAFPGFDCNAVECSALGHVFSLRV
jgi:hypothetical protein